jgi:ribonuclease VapC
MKGLSLGDRACLALAVNRNAEVFTADKVWEGLDVPVTIHMIR